MLKDPKLLLKLLEMQKDNPQLLLLLHMLLQLPQVMVGVEREPIRRVEREVMVVVVVEDTAAKEVVMAAKVDMAKVDMAKVDMAKQVQLHMGQLVQVLLNTQVLPKVPHPTVQLGQLMQEKPQGKQLLMEHRGEVRLVQVMQLPMVKLLARVAKKVDMVGLNEVRMEAQSMEAQNTVGQNTVVQSTLEAQSTIATKLNKFR